jgi:hypothetical protein
LKQGKPENASLIVQELPEEKIVTEKIVDLDWDVSSLKVKEKLTFVS